MTINYTIDLPIIWESIWIMFRLLFISDKIQKNIFMRDKLLLMSFLHLFKESELGLSPDFINLLNLQLKIQVLSKSLLEKFSKILFSNLIKNFLLNFMLHGVNTVIPLPQVMKKLLEFMKQSRRCNPQDWLIYQWPR